ncbi:lysine--tRNA ligase [Candidatus Saccharibacteria bacterium CG10_big_fil_rev_8_21_14_0_10_47_8]|nr:MAG: lysine--tRNA ligase [Candidatus Saccharibacteria bacterium CG10_big_fil_rev_8_21_14_0_10_47_8]
MQWLNKIIDEIITRHPEGEIIIESGISPSGSYHMGYLREIITCDAVKQELERRGRRARHIHFVDDLDGFRKVPTNLPADYKKYLGKPLCDMPAPDGSGQSYADYALKDFLDSVDKLGIKIDLARSHEKYREGFFTEAIEKTLQNLPRVRGVLEKVSGRKLEKDWAPIQVNEDGYLKSRRFVLIDTKAKRITYLDADDKEQTTDYCAGEVKLNWRLDWPARWWLLKVAVEPFGRDHATKGGSYDTGAALMKEIFSAPAPLPIPYDFVNRAGDTKKMSASKGNGILMSEVVTVLPPEVARYFILRYSPDKQLFFDPQGGVVRLIDEFAALLAKPGKSEDERKLVELSTNGFENTVSSVPFSHLVASYQASLKDADATLEVVKRTEHADAVEKEAKVIKAELKFIEQWLFKWAPEEVKFELAQKVDASQFSDEQKQYLNRLADKIVKMLDGADGEWFHKAIYEFKESDNLSSQQLFTPLYRALIGKDFGPRAGWFLSILPRDWLIKRLRLEA